MQPEPTELPDHAWFRERIAPFVAGGLSPSELARFGAHRADCADCVAELERYVAVDRAMKERFETAVPSSSLEDRLVNAFRRDAVGTEVGSAGVPRPPSSSRRASSPKATFSPFMQRAAGVCAATILLGVVWYVLGNSSTHKDAPEVAVNNPPAEPPRQEKLPRPSLGDIVNEKDKPTDPQPDANDIVVPPDIRARAELGDHFETINPDLPDTHNAYGQPDAHSFHSVQPDPSNPPEPAGGGGMNGMGTEDLLGVGGAASKGTGGGFGGGDGTGVGVGTGAGQGSFGQRNGGGRKLMVKRHGGSKATESAVDKALDWLAAHQEADGHWDATKYGVADKRENVTVTALSLLAFLGAGHSEKVGLYKSNVQLAVNWLERAPVDGTINTDFLPGIIATLALSEAGGMGNVPATRAEAQKMLDAYVQEPDAPGKNPWFANIDHESDFILAGWCTMMFKSAKVAGLKVKPAAFESASKFLDSAESKDAADKVSRYGFTEAGKFHSTSRTNAIGNLARMLLGMKTEDTKVCVDAFVTEFGTPAWDAEAKKVDFEYWYFGTLCTFQIGGDTWKHWNEDLKKTLVENQVAGGDDAGSWNAVGYNASAHGRVGQTALGALCLETYYRYLRLDPSK